MASYTFIMLMSLSQNITTHSSPGLQWTMKLTTEIQPYLIQCLRVQSILAFPCWVWIWGSTEPCCYIDMNINRSGFIRIHILSFLGSVCSHNINNNIINIVSRQEHNIVWISTSELSLYHETTKVLWFHSLRECCFDSGAVMVPPTAKCL